MNDKSKTRYDKGARIMRYPPPPLDVEVVVNNGRRATLAFAHVYDPLTDEYIHTTGEAIRHPEDKHDPELAEALALGRALGNLSNKLLRRANGRVKCNDDNARKAQQASEAPVADGRCHGITGAGTRCTRQATHNDFYCKVHWNMLG